MRVVVDTNIVFSALLNTDSKIGRVILKPKTRFNFYSSKQLLGELHAHSGKLKKLSSYSTKELDRVTKIITRKIRFINIEFIPSKLYQKAESLTHDIDIDDCEFVALTEHVKGKLWSGDKELKEGLRKKNWTKFVSTEELYLLTKSKSKK